MAFCIRRHNYPALQIVAGALTRMSLAVLLIYTLLTISAAAFVTGCVGFVVGRMTAIHRLVLGFET